MRLPLLAPRPRRPRSRLPRTAIVLFLLTTLALVGVPASAVTGTYVRFAELAPGLDRCRLLVTPVMDAAGTVTIPGGPAGTVSDYVLVRPGDQVLAVQPLDAPEPVLVRATLLAREGAAYTVATVPDGDGTQLLVVTDDLTPPAPGRARVRIVDARGGGAPLGLDPPAATSIDQAAIGDYADVPAGPVTVRAGAASASADVEAGTVVSLVVTGADDRVSARAVVDAAAPAEPPPGPVRAGRTDVAGSGPGWSAGVLGLLGLIALAIWTRSARLVRGR